MGYYDCGGLTMGVYSLESLINIVHIISFTIKGDGKVFIHCHGGNDRTGLVIA
jgi:protein-tyrosine phosphatase